MYIDKQYVRRDLRVSVSLWPDPFAYRPITELPEAEVVRVVDLVTTDSLGRDLESDARAQFLGMVEFAGSVYDPSRWMVAYKDTDPAGVVFAQQYHDLLHAGSIFLMGLAPQYRGGGLGKVVHAKGLTLLKEIGCELYIGSTDTNNSPMLKVFAQNGCTFTRIHRVRIEPGLGVIDEEGEDQ